MRKFAEKRTWVRQHLGDISSDAELLTTFAKHFSIRDEGKASQELREILETDRSVEDQFQGSSAARHLALGQRLLDMMVTDKAFGPAAQVWKAMSQVKGLEQQKVSVEVSAGPNPDIVRARIAKLIASKTVRDNAEEMGIDLDKLASGDLDNAISPDSSAWAWRQNTRAQADVDSTEAGNHPEGEPSDDRSDSERSGDRENPLAMHLAKARELGTP